jgi:hypothetical protein
MQAWKFFGLESLEDFLQSEDTLDFNVLTYKIDFDKIHNNTSWVLQLVNKTTIVFFYYNCNYQFMLMTT